MIGAKCLEDMNTRHGITGYSTTTSPAHRRLGPRILVADDDGIVRQLNASVLTQAGYEVDLAEDGAGAWEALQTNHYDMLVTDNNMPRMTGTDLVNALRSAGMGLPVVVASGSLDQVGSEWVETVSQLAKPYGGSQLLEKVRGLLSPAPEPSTEPAY